MNWNVYPHRNLKQKCVSYERPTSYRKLNFPAQIFHGTVFYISVVLGFSPQSVFNFHGVILLLVFRFLCSPPASMSWKKLLLWTKNLCSWGCRENRDGLLRLKGSEQFEQWYKCMMLKRLNIYCPILMTWERSPSVYVIAIEFSFATVAAQGCKATHELL
jgi:hypothetical protein